jgi:hypothetical protein
VGNPETARFVIRGMLVSFFEEFRIALTSTEFISHRRGQQLGPVVLNAVDQRRRRLGDRHRVGCGDQQSGERDRLAFERVNESWTHSRLVSANSVFLAHNP